MLGAVAMVDIPVNDGNPINALQRMLCGNRDIVQETESHGTSLLRMVAGWPDKGKSMFAIKGTIHCCKRPTRGMQRRFE